MQTPGCFLRIMKKNQDDYKNIVNIDGSRYRSDKPVKKPNRGLWGKLTPEFIGVGILFLIFLYLIINIMIYRSKKQVSIFEVQAQNIEQDSIFEGICIRDEKIVTAPMSGYLNYYIGNKCKASKNSIVYSIDSSDAMYTAISTSMDDIILDSEEISRIKNVIMTRMRDYNGSDLSWLDGFRENLNSIVYDIVNENILEKALEMRKDDKSLSGFTTFNSETSGVVSYHSDVYAGISADNVTADTFKDTNVSLKLLKTSGLIGAGTPVYRICGTDEWSIVVKVSEKFYLDNLEERSAKVYLNDDILPLSGNLRLYSSDKDYFAELTFDKYMARYIDERFVRVRFSSSEDKGLKIPVSAIFKKGYYLVPLSMFVKADGYNGYILKKEIYDPAERMVGYKDIYPEKYYSDGYYAYIEMDGELSEGDYLDNPDTGDRYRVGLVNYLDGVYNVNKGYYIFTRIEKLRSNSEYAIIKANTPDGVRQYDHIALNAGDAVDQALIY